MDPKLSLAVCPATVNVSTYMTKPLLLCVLATAVALTSGCGMFSRNKNPRAKESSAIASEVEASFRQRWTDKRVGELAAQGKAPEVARAEADAEFRERFPFIQPPGKKR